jgi:hypothetical protein
MISRWWVYQQEQFPVFRNGLLVGILSLASVSHAVLLRSRGLEGLAITPLTFTGTVLIATISLFLFFLQIQVVREFWGVDKASRYKLSRPVAEGLISLKELGLLAIASGSIQLGLSLSLSGSLLMPLVLLWGYVGLSFRRFFADRWPKPFPLVHAVAYIAAVPLACFYATACYWMQSSIGTPAGLEWFLVAGALSSLTVVISSSIQSSNDANQEMRPLFVRWGRPVTIRVWLGLIWLTTLATLVSGMYIQLTLPIALLLLLLLTGAVFVAWRFLVRPTSQWARRLEVVSQLWLFLMALVLGPFALLVKAM